MIVTLANEENSVDSVQNLLVVVRRFSSCIFDAMIDIVVAHLPQKAHLATTLLTVLLLAMMTCCL